MRVVDSSSWAGFEVPKHSTVAEIFDGSDESPDRAGPGGIADVELTVASPVHDANGSSPKIVSDAAELRERSLS
jgi:hypothetical protein